MAAYKIPNPERERTERNRELKRLRTKTEPGQERAEMAADLAVRFHEERAINEAMELAQMVRDDVEDGVSLLTKAYLDEVDGVEDQMERIAMLANVARWIDDEALESSVRRRGVDLSVEWCQQTTDEIERMERFEVIERRFDEALRREVQKVLG